jgi:hypothetical protein
MKFKLALILIFSFGYSFLQAQKIQYGLTSAINISNVSGTGMSPKYMTGFEAGGFAKILLNKDFSLQPELVYNYMKAARSDNFSTYYVDNSRNDASLNFNLAYVSIPILLDYQVSAKLTLNAGAQYNVLVYSNENLVYNKQAFKNSDWGVRGGIQFSPSSNFNLFASYYYGLGNINNIDNRYQWKSRQFNIGVNVILFKGK